MNADGTENLDKAGGKFTGLRFLSFVSLSISGFGVGVLTRQDLNGSISHVGSWILSFSVKHQLPRYVE
jgi:hypothetical protein